MTTDKVDCGDPTCDLCAEEIPHTHVDPKVDVAPQEPLFPSAYLGDGVYASFDGYHIWLAVNHHENQVVALELGVMEELLEYARRIWRIV